MKRITSGDNRLFKQWQLLQKPQQAREQGRIFVEGLRLCRDVLASSAAVEAAIISDSALTRPEVSDFLISLPAQIELINLPDQLMQRLSQTRQPQGIALICHSPLIEQPAGDQTGSADLASPPAAQGLYLAADQVQDPGNLGTLIRTADAFAFDGVLLTAGTVWPLNDKVIRASMGSVFHLPLIQFPELKSLKSWLSRAGIPLLAADLNGESSLDSRLAGPAALLISNEARGISEQARQLADRRLSIPMPGQAESLNAAAAAAILCYELMRGRLEQGKNGQNTSGGTQ